MPVFLTTRKSGKQSIYLGLSSSFHGSVSLLPDLGSIFPLTAFQRVAVDPIYCVTQTSGKEGIFYGPNSDHGLQLSISGYTLGQPKQSHRWHMGRVKVNIVRKVKEFQSVYPGTVLGENEFQFIHPNGYLKIRNLIAASGITEDSAGGYDISTGNMTQVQGIMSNIFPPPERI